MEQLRDSSTKDYVFPLVLACSVYCEGDQKMYEEVITETDK